MPNSLKLVGFTSAALLTSLTLLAGCDDGTADDGGVGASPGSGSGAATGAGAGTGAGATGAGGTATGAGGTATGAGGTATGAGGTATGAGGTATGAGGSTGGVGSGGVGTGGGGAGGTATGGAGGSTGGTGPGTDANGKGIAAPGDMSTVNQDYIRIGPDGEIRLLNNNWGSEALNCTGSSFSVFYNQDKSFGWTFNRPSSCDGGGQKPDFPQIEFGIHPFGIGNSLVTSPEFSSTTLLPLQAKDIQSASVDIEGLNITFQDGMDDKWNITFEFWLANADPRTQSTGAHFAYAELMTFWGWEPGRWPADGPGMNGSCDGGSGCGATVTSSGKTYTLNVQRDNWADGWRYFQFRENGGSKQTFTGKVDVKPLLDYLITTRGYSSDLWVTRLEVGSEIDVNTKGKVQLDNITFEVNGQTRSAGKKY